jgi:hypothetical protein
MTPPSQHAARFWLQHRHDLKKLEGEASRLLQGEVPGKVETALAELAKEIEGTPRVARFGYTAFDKSEIAILIHRTQWRHQEEIPRIGIGFGQRMDEAGTLTDGNSPFYGIWAADETVWNLLRARLGGRPWNEWAWWNYVDLTPPAGDFDDLAVYYADAAKEHVCTTWRDYIAIIDEVAALAVTDIPSPSTDTSED